MNTILTTVLLFLLSFLSCNEYVKEEYSNNYVSVENGLGLTSYYYTSWEHKSEKVPNVTLVPVKRYDNVIIEGKPNFFSHVYCLKKTREGYLIADKEGKKVIRCDNNFKTINVIGNEGQGPGEFGSPRIIDAEGELVYTSTTSNRGFATHAISGDLINSFQPQTEVYNPIISKFIVKDKKLIISTPNEENPITILDSEGKKLNSFGKKMAHHVKPDKFFRNRGHIVNYNDSRFLFVGLDGPIIQEYDLKGNLLYEHSFVDHPYFKSFFNGVKIRKRKSEYPSNTTYTLFQDVILNKDKIYLLTVSYSLDAEESLSKVLILKKVNQNFIMEKTLELTYPDLGIEKPWFESFCVDDTKQQLTAFDHTSGAFLTFDLPD